MKTVWVLERKVPVQETVDHIKELREWNDPESDRVAAKLEAELAENPDGYWLGYVGRSNYRDWCWDAKDFIRRHKGTEFGKAPLRVVKAQIPDNSRTWVGYTNAVVNEGVLRYLYATA